MKLWILKPIDPDNAPWDPWYDKAFGFVVRAETEADARSLAGEQAGTKKSKDLDPWADHGLSTCEELTAEGEAGVVIQDFYAA